MKTAKQFLVLLFSVLTFCNYGQVVDWINAHGNNNSTSGRGVVADALGNAYTTGVYSTDQAVFGTFSLSPIGSFDVYVTKTSPSGITKWAKALGGIKTDDATAISIDGLANLYVVGTFSQNAAFGTYTLTTTTSAAYVCKLDSSGNVLWAKKYAEPGLSTISSITNDPVGNIYISGGITGTCVIGSNTLTTGGDIDAFVAKLDNTGNVLWAKKMGGILNDNANSLTIDGTGNIYVTGSFEGNAAFGSYFLNSTSNFSSFIFKIDGGGTVLWATKFGGNNDTYGSSITASATGKIYACGSYTPPATFGVTTFTSGDSYVCQIDATGLIIWATKYESLNPPAETNQISSVASDAMGNVYTTGLYSGTIAFGTTTTSAAVLTNTISGGYAAFFCKLDASGNFVWVNDLYGIATLGFSITYQSGKLYSTGEFADFSIIDTYTINTAPLSNKNSYLLKLNAIDVGIKESIKELNAFVYPNPTNDKLFIELKEKGEEVHYSFTDVSGKELITKKRITINETIDVSHYAEGVYFLQLETKERTAVRKIVIQ